MSGRVVCSFVAVVCLMSVACGSKLPAPSDSGKPTAGGKKDDKPAAVVSGPVVNEHPKPETVAPSMGVTAAVAPEVKKTTITEIVKQAPNVPLQTVVYKMLGGYVKGQQTEVEITFQAPANTKVDPRESTIMFSKTAGLLIDNAPFHITNQVRWWTDYGMYRAKAITQAPETLFVESTEERPDRFSAQTLVAVGPIELHLRFMDGSGNTVGVHLGQQDEVLQMLKIARSAVLNTKLPEKPADLINFLGGSADDRSGDGKIDYVDLDGLSNSSRVLALVKAFPDLEELKLSTYSARIRPGSLTVLNDLRKLKTLSTGDMWLSDADLKAIGECPELTTLEINSEMENRMSATGFQNLMKAKKLKRLSFNPTGLEASQFEPLISQGELEKLTFGAQVDVYEAGKYGTKTTDMKGVLQYVARLPKLQSLTLWGDSVTDEALGQLKSLKTLNELKVSNTKVTATGMADLKKSLPNLTTSGP